MKTFDIHIKIAKVETFEEVRAIGSRISDKYAITGRPGYILHPKGCILKTDGWERHAALGQDYGIGFLVNIGIQELNIFLKNVPNWELFFQGLSVVRERGLFFEALLSGNSEEVIVKHIHRSSCS